MYTGLQGRTKTPCVALIVGASGGRGRGRAGGPAAAPSGSGCMYTEACNSRHHRCCTHQYRGHHRNCTAGSLRRTPGDIQCRSSGNYSRRLSSHAPQLHLQPESDVQCQQVTSTSTDGTSPSSKNIRNAQLEKASDRLPQHAEHLGGQATSRFAGEGPLAYQKIGDP